MGKKSKSQSRNLKKKDDKKGQSAGSKKSDAKREKVAAKAVADDIARAEKNLAKTISKLESVREELAEREAALRTLLVRHGRMPEQRVETFPLFDQEQVRNPIDEYFGDNGSDDIDAMLSETDQQQVPASGDGSDDGHQG